MGTEIGVPGRVLVALDDGPGVAAPTWTRIDDLAPNFVAEIEIDTGRQDELDQTKTGSAVIRCNDRDGILDSSNTGSPLYGKLDGKQIAIQLYDPVAESWYGRFRGIIDDYGYDLNPATNRGVGKSILSNVQIQCVDRFDYLAGAQMLPGVHGFPIPAGSGAEGQVFYEEQEVNDRIFQLLNEAAVDEDLCVVFTGNVWVQESLYDPGSSFLVALREAADAEFPGIANIYVDRFGRFVFHGRGARLDPDTVSDDAGATAWDFHRWPCGDGQAIAAADGPMAQIRPPFSFRRPRSRVINAALVTYAGVKGTEVPSLVVTDATSITNLGLHPETWEELIIKKHKTNGNTAFDECQLFSQFWVQNYKDPHDRIEQITFKSLRPDDPRAYGTWGVLARSDISDILNVSVGYPGGSGFSNSDHHVEGWKQTIRPLGQDTYDMVELTLNVSPAAQWTTDVWA